MRSKGRFAGMVVLVVIAVTISAYGQSRTEYPNREIELIVAFAPGGSEDMRARTLAAKLTEILGQPVVVVNKPGASGTVGMTLLAKAKPDGYTIGSTSASPLIFAPHLQKVEYDPVSDFTYICGSATQPFAICVKQDARWKAMDELLDYAKLHPGEIKYAHPGTGHQSHVYMEAVCRARGVKMVGIPFKGDSESITALLGGHVVVASLASTFIPHAKAGKIRPLAMFSESRVRLFPEVPTLKELGFKFDLRAPTVLGYGAPKGLPPEIRRKLEGAFEQAIKSPEFATVLKQLDNEVLYRQGETYKKLISELYQAIGKMLKELETSPTGK